MAPDSEARVISKYEASLLREGHRGVPDSSGRWFGICSRWRRQDWPPAEICAVETKMSGDTDEFGRGPPRWLADHHTDGRYLMKFSVLAAKNEGGAALKGSIIRRPQSESFDLNGADVALNEGG